MTTRRKDAQKDDVELISGYIEKKSRLGAWNKRFFVIAEANPHLMYYPDDKKSRGPLGDKGGHLDLRIVDMVKLSGKVVTLHLHDRSKYQLRFGQESEARKWRDVLYDVTVKGAGARQAQAQAQARRPRLTFPPSDAGEGRGGAKGQGAALSDSEDEPAPDLEEPLGYFLLTHTWLALALFCLVASTVAVVPVPTLDLWFFKVFVLSGVLHASVLSLLALAGAVSLAAAVAAHALSRPKRLLLAACAAFAGAAGLVALPAALNLPLAAQLPAAVEAFLAESGLAGAAAGAAAAGAAPQSARPAFSAAAFLEDVPCALANVWEYYNYTSEVVYKQVPKAPAAGASAAAPGGADDWSGLGGLSGRNDTAPGLRLAVFRDKSAPAGAKLPVLVSFHGGGWYRGSLYDGLQCYLPAALGAGFAVVAGEYRSGAAGWRGRDMVEDAVDLLAWVQAKGAERGLDPSKVVVMGGGAGAHVGTVAAYLTNAKAKRQLVRGVFGRYGPVGDLAAAHAAASALPRGLVDWATASGRGWSERVALEHIAGGPPAAAAAEYAFLSAPSHVGPFTPPTVLLHCAHDEFYDPKAHTRSLAAALAAAGRPHLVLAPAMHSHGCDIGSTAPFQLLHFALVAFLEALAAA